MVKHGWVLVSAMTLWPAVALAQPGDEEGEPADQDEPSGMTDTEESAPDDTPAEETPAEEAPAVEGEPAAAPPMIEIHGFASLGYTLNAFRPDDGVNRFRVFDGKHNSFSLDVAEVVVQRVPTAPGEVGFRIDVAAGTTVPQLSASAGMGFGEHVDLQQAYASWVAPVGTGLRLDAGKFVTWAGSEVIEGFDGYNDHYSHSWLFGYAIPFGHVGVRGGYAVSPTLTVQAQVTNGWDVAVDNNSGKSWALNAAIAAGDKANIYVTYLGGPEQPDSADLRNVIDVVAVVRATEQVTVTANAAFGHEQIGDESATWWGAAVYGKYDTGEKLSASLRAEFFGDPDNHRMAVPMLDDGQALLGVTVTPSYKVDSNLAIRGDVRVDLSTKDVFLSQDEATSNQLTFGINVLAAM